MVKSVDLIELFGEQSEEDMMSLHSMVDIISADTGEVKSIPFSKLQEYAFNLHDVISFDIQGDIFGCRKIEFEVVHIRNISENNIKKQKVYFVSKRLWARESPRGIRGSLDRLERVLPQELTAILEYIDHKHETPNTYCGNSYSKVSIPSMANVSKRNIREHYGYDDIKFDGLLSMKEKSRLANDSWAHYEKWYCDTPSEDRGISGVGSDGRCMYAIDLWRGSTPYILPNIAIITYVNK